MSAKRYSCIWPQAGHVIFPFCSAASLTNIEKTLPQILQESSTLISLILPLRRFGLSEMLHGRSPTESCWQPWKTRCSRSRQPDETKNHLAQQTAATCKRWPGAMFDTPANASSVILTFLRFAARVSGETRSCVSRLRVPSARGAQWDQSVLQTSDPAPPSMLLP